jgi:hypothetical protein
VENEREARREEIRQRLVAIRTRIDELETSRHGDRPPAACTERLARAQRQTAVAQAAAQRGIAAAIHAFHSAGQAHDRLAAYHERAAAAGSGDKGEHERQAAIHRAAALADTQRAERAGMLLWDEMAP